MKKKLALLIASLGVAGIALADNPIIQTIYTADPAPMVYKDRLYVLTGDTTKTRPNFSPCTNGAAIPPPTW